MSLVPPCAHRVYERERGARQPFESCTRNSWTDGLPTNALLVSGGPSKTADIQQTLAYGAHGPKEPLVLVIAGARRASWARPVVPTIPRRGLLPGVESDSRRPTARLRRCGVSAGPSRRDRATGPAAPPHPQPLP